MTTSRSKNRGGKELAQRRAALERVAERVAAERLRKEAALAELAADFELARQDEEAAAAEVEVVGGQCGVDVCRVVVRVQDEYDRRRLGVVRGGAVMRGG
ncbi:hypothetical protein OHB03_49660 (plasmid) [Streptomyces sp. NBC_01643]|nr:hypothetical protein OHB03_49660 [Streptomyces sp. NBC_01643]